MASMPAVAVDASLAVVVLAEPLEDFHHVVNLVRLKVLERFLHGRTRQLALRLSHDSAH